MGDSWGGSFFDFLLGLLCVCLCSVSGTSMGILVFMSFCVV